jgi:hypothetical protein
MDDLWTPTQTHARRERPGARKTEGGSIFDDELGTEAEAAKAYADAVEGLLTHLNQRPDHTVYVGSDEERTKMREVFNVWKMKGALLHNPNIRIDYGVPEGAIRVGDGR